jgi:Flp pilus assembly protein TadD
LAQFQAAVRINPEDANAEANLGSAFAESGDLKQAKLHYERALRLNPNHELARENLQQLSREANPR